MMFNIGFSEILIISLVSIILFDKKKMLEFIIIIKDLYKSFLVIRLKIKNFMKDSGIDDLCKYYDIEKINYIVDEDGKFYFTTNHINSVFQDINKNNPNNSSNK